MAYFAGLISILALSLVGPALHDVSGVALRVRPAVQKSLVDGHHSRFHLQTPNPRISPVISSDLMSRFSESEDDHLGKSLLDVVAAALRGRPFQDDDDVFRGLTAIDDRDPASGRLMPRRC